MYFNENGKSTVLQGVKQFLRCPMINLMIGNTCCNGSMFFDTSSQIFVLRCPIINCTIKEPLWVIGLRRFH